MCWADAEVSLQLGLQDMVLGQPGSQLYASYLQVIKQSNDQPDKNLR